MLLINPAKGVGARDRVEPQVALPVEGMACPICAARVKTAVQALEGVSDVEVSLAEGMVRVRYAPDIVSAARIAEAIDRLGFKAGAPRDMK